MDKASVQTETRSIIRIDSKGRSEKDDLIIREHALTIILNDNQFVKNRRYITIYCSLSDLEMLGVGFLLSDGLIESKADISALNLSDDGSELNIFVNVSLAESLFAKRDITSGCGRSLSSGDALEASKIGKISSDIRIRADSIIRLADDFQSMSELFKSTGGTHAAALSDGERILIFKEDIGRHNAVDKVFGESLMSEVKTDDKLIITSGRISSEMLIKSAKRGIPIIVSRSAPTSMALDLAEKAGITLIGFARGRRMNVYSHDHRIEL